MCRLHLTVGHNKSISVEIKSVVVSLSKACVKMSHTLTLAIIYSSEEALIPHDHLPHSSVSEHRQEAHL